MTTTKTNRMAAILLLITLGYFGVHSFYQKKTLQGVLYVLAFTTGFMFLVPSIIAGIFLLVELYKLMTISDEEYAQLYENSFEDNKKSGLTAGAIGLVGGIFGLHFSYLGMMKAAKNRFLMFFLPLPFLVVPYIFLFVGLGFENRYLEFIINNTDPVGLAVLGVFFIALIYYFVLYILSLVESYRYFQQEHVEK
jgi:TM2 domain-containing membrane protein YozV